MFKNLDTAENWGVFSSELDNWATDLHLNTSDQKNNFYSTYPIADPTSNVFYTNYLTSQNVLNDDFIAYCFTSITGYQSVGSYSYNASGINKDLGFKPRFLLLKRTDSTGSGRNWSILDSARTPSDPREDYLLANTSDAEAENTSYDIEFDSDGFNITSTSSPYNQSGATYIYLAIK